MIDRRDSVEPANVLLVEPDAETARDVRAGFRTDRFQTVFHSVSDPDEALAFLRREGEYEDAPRPCLILLRLDRQDDGGDGLEVLEAIGEQSEFGRIPLVALVETTTERTIQAAYRLGANAVVPTPTDPDALRETMALIAEFWVGTARLPNRIDRRY